MLLVKEFGFITFFTKYAGLAKNISHVFIKRILYCIVLERMISIEMKGRTVRSQHASGWWARALSVSREPSGVVYHLNRTVYRVPHKSRQWMQKCVDLYKLTECKDVSKM